MADVYADDVAAFVTARLDEAARESMRWHDVECDYLSAALDTRLAWAQTPDALCTCGGPAQIRVAIMAQRQIVADEVDGWSFRDDVMASLTVGSTGTDGLYAVSYGDDVYTEYVTEEVLRRRYGQPRAASRALRLLASMWGQHPDYREEWRP
jgi:hypothetical protein